MTLDRDQVAAALPAYEVGEELGRGAFGVVLAARHRHLRREVAVKELPIAFSSDPEVRSRFVTEARTLASLDHPHIVPIYDYVEHEGLCLLVMERLTGGSVGQRAWQGLITRPQACAIVLATCAGLQYAHDHGVLHRDIKPENLILSGEGVVKVTDFGVAKVLGGAASFATRTGLIVGTPAYIAPEQVQGGELGPATDVYATATVLYELLAGRLPYPADGVDAATLLYRHVHEDAQPLVHVARDVPPMIGEVVDHGLARDFADRYPTPEEFGIALAEAATSAWGAEWPKQTGVPIRQADSILAPTEERSRAAPTVVSGRSSPAEKDTAPESPPGSLPWRLPEHAGPSARPARRRVIVMGSIAAVLVAGITIWFVTRNRSSSHHGLALPMSCAPSASARPVVFNAPAAVLTDPTCDLFVSELGGNIIRRVARNGAVTVIAGTGEQSSLGDAGRATAATLNQPAGLALDRYGNLYVAEFYGNRIRKISPGGTITTLAGTGRQGSTGDGGPAVEATLNGPIGVLVDDAGDVYVGEHGGNRVRKITPDGIIATAAGTGQQGSTGDGGPATRATLNGPERVVLGARGELYIGEWDGNRVRKITPDGIITTVAGTGSQDSTGDGGLATNATLNHPTGLAIDNGGNLFVAEGFGNRVRKVTPDGIISTVVGTGHRGDAGDGGPATAATLNGPTGLTFDPAGNLFITEDCDNSTCGRVRVVARSGTVSTFG